ncbi:hypothetical protein WJX77_009885 [Trebouxia sp. C0004]
MQLDDLPDDSLKQVFQQLSTNDRRIISLVQRKWQQLVAESWTRIDIRLGGTNYLDSASKQITWLLSLRLQRLHTLHLNLKGVELSGIAVDYLLFPFLDTLEQGAFSQLQTLHLSADMSLPGPLIHHSLQHLQLDMRSFGRPGPLHFAVAAGFGVVTGYYTFEPAIRKHFEGPGQSQLPASPSIYLSKTGSKAAPEQPAAPTGPSNVPPQHNNVARAAE